MADLVDTATQAAAQAAGAANTAAGSATLAAHSAAGAVDIAAGAATAAAHSGSTSYAAIIVAVTALVTTLATWAASRRKTMSEDRSAAFQELMNVVAMLRGELDTQRAQLDVERAARSHAEDEARLAQGELHVLRLAMRRRTSTNTGSKPKILPIG